MHELGPALRQRSSLEFEPPSSGQLHLRAEPEEAAGFAAFDPPEVDGVPLPQIVGIAPPAPEPDAADQAVEDTTQSPDPVGVRVAAVAAEAGDRRAQRRPGAGGPPRCGTGPGHGVPGAGRRRAVGNRPGPGRIPPLRWGYPARLSRRGSDAEFRHSVRRRRPSGVACGPRARNNSRRGSRSVASSSGARQRQMRDPRSTRIGRGNTADDW